MPSKQEMIDLVMEYEMEVNYLTRVQADEHVRGLTDKQLAKEYEDVLNNWIRD